MNEVIWSDQARRDYFEILRHIAPENPDAADRVLVAIETTGNNLADFAIGHPGRVSGTYGKSVRGLPYIVAYALALTDGDRTVSILRVIHAARDWQSDSWPQQDIARLPLESVAGRARPD